MEPSSYKIINSYTLIFHEAIAKIRIRLPEQNLEGDTGL